MSDFVIKPDLLDAHVAEHSSSHAEKLIARATQRIDALFANGLHLGQLVAFHSCEKMLLLAHDRSAYETLGRLVATAKQRSKDDVMADYRKVFHAALEKTVTRGAHTNVLQHMAGYFRKLLSHDERHQMKETIDQYLGGKLPLIEPLNVLHQHAQTHQVTYLLQQTYFAAYGAKTEP